MTLLRLNLGDDARFALHDSPQDARMALLRAARGAGPITLLIHGYRCAPGHLRRCPHRRLFAPDGAWAQAFAGEETPGLTIALGWNARGPFARAYLRARRLGENLAAVIALLHAVAPRRPVNLVAHSLGAELALAAVAAAPAQSLARVVLLTGASFLSHAKAALQSPAGRNLELLNITSRENDLFDFAFERAVPSVLRGDRALGAGITGPRVANLQIDCPVTLARLTTLGLPLAPPRSRICHWSSYTRPGALALYARFLRDPAGLPVSLLRQLAPAEPAPRWSRLWGAAAPPLPGPLSLGRFSRRRPRTIFPAP